MTEVFLPGMQEMQSTLAAKQAELQGSQALDQAELAILRERLANYSGSFEMIIEQLKALANFWQSVSSPLSRVAPCAFDHFLLGIRFKAILGLP